MRVDIQPQWKKLANWYWDTLEGKTVHESGMSIWDMLQRDYGAIKVRHGVNGGKYGMKKESIVKFPDEKMYTAFVLRWS